MANRVWPIEVEDAIQAALIAGTPTETILVRLRTGELPGIERGYAIPRSTFYQSLSRVKQRLASGGPDSRRTRLGHDVPEQFIEASGGLPPLPGESGLAYLSRASEQPDFVLHHTADGSPCTCRDCEVHNGPLAKPEQLLAAFEGRSEAASQKAQTGSQMPRERAIAALERLAEDAG